MKYHQAILKEFMFLLQLSFLEFYEVMLTCANFAMPYLLKISEGIIIASVI